MTRPSPAILAAAASCLFLASCTGPRAEVRPPVELPERFSATGNAPMHDRWWLAFDDPQLDGLVQQAMAGNFSLRVVWDRLDQARALARRTAAPLWPALDASVGATRTANETNRKSVAATAFDLGLVVSYEVDLWGRISSTYDAAVIDADATAEDLQAAALTLSAQVAQTYVLLAEQRSQLVLLDEQLETNRKYLEAIDLRFQRGRSSATDVLQQRQLVEQVEGEQYLARAAIEVLQHQLAVLLGRPPGTIEAPETASLPAVPPQPQTGLPAAWLRRRPDIRAAERRIQAADRRVWAAVADQFPRLVLSAQGTTSAERIRDLFDNWAATLAADLLAPLFDGGERRAEVDRTRAVLSERLNSYGQVVLVGLQEVEDALAQEARQAEYLASLARQIELARKATDQTLENYTKGTMDFVRYLTTLLSYQRLQRTYLAAERDLILYRIDLYRALAGGWPLPEPRRAVVGTERPGRGAPEPNPERPES